MSDIKPDMVWNPVLGGLKLTVYCYKGEMYDEEGWEHFKKSLEFSNKMENLISQDPKEPT